MLLDPPDILAPLLLPDTVLSRLPAEIKLLVPVVGTGGGGIGEKAVILPTAVTA